MFINSIYADVKLVPKHSKYKKNVYDIIISPIYHGLVGFAQFIHLLIIFTIFFIT